MDEWLNSNLKYKWHLSRQYHLWSLRCSWSFACLHCFIYIFILDLTPHFSGLDKDNDKTRRETFKFWDLMRLILEIWRYIPMNLCDVNSSSLLQLHWWIIQTADGTRWVNTQKKTFHVTTQINDESSQAHSVECVSKIKSILSIVFHAIYGTLCIQLTHDFYDDCENTCTLSCHHN